MTGNALEEAREMPRETPLLGRLIDGWRLLDVRYKVLVSAQALGELAAIFGSLVLSPACWPSEDAGLTQQLSVAVLLVGSILSMVIGVVFQALRAKPGSDGYLLWQAQRYYPLIWMFMVTVAINIQLASYTGLWVFHFSLGALVTYAWIHHQFFAAGFVQRRLELLERSCGSQLGSRAVAKARAVVPAVALLQLISLGEWLWGHSAGHEPWAMRADLSMFLLDACVWAGLATVGLVTAAVSARAVTGLMSSTAEVHRCLPAASFAAAEALWARHELGRLRAALALPSLLYGACAYGIVFAWLSTEGFDAPSHGLGLQSSTLDRTFMLVGSVVNVVNLCVESAGVFCVTHVRKPRLKVCGGAAQITTRRERAASAASAAAARACERDRPVLLSAGSRTADWSATVDALASRSITLGELLSFLESLGTVMPHFDPWRSLTRDVVRQAIIPLTVRREGGPGGMAYADLMERDDAGRLPHCMVSHTWSGRFLDLVAAVVAHALHCDEYGELACRLATASGPADIRREMLSASLGAGGKLQQRYWICCFCVNQHRTICAGFGPQPPVGTPQHRLWDASRRDTCTGALFSPCDCGEPKCTAGDLCEVNKFDDMMELQGRLVPHFHHLVVCDSGLEVFTRAWCVAELVQGHSSRLSQSVLIEANSALTDDVACYARLSRLSVARCQASRQEDKDMILAKIPDVRAFDAQLQATIFGGRGLLRHALSGFDGVDAAGRAARRAMAIQQVVRATVED